MESVNFDDVSSLILILFTNVKNSSSLMSQLSTLDCSLLNAKFIPCSNVVKVAAWKAINDEKNKTLMTKSVYAEVVFNLGPDYAITRSLQTFGIGKDTTDILVCLINANEEKIVSVCEKIDGTRQNGNLDEKLDALYDKEKLISLYDITKKESEKSIENAIINRISCKISKKLEILIE